MQVVIHPLRSSWLPERFSLKDHNGVEGEDRLATWYMFRVKNPKVSGSGKILDQDKLHDLFLALRERRSRRATQHPHLCSRQQEKNLPGPGRGCSRQKHGRTPPKKTQQDFASLLDTLHLNHHPPLTRAQVSQPHKLPGQGYRAES